MRRRCIVCQRLIPTGSRCTQHRRQQRAKYHGDWPAHAKATIDAHLATHGPTCPGWRREPHEVEATDLTLDHDIGILCRSCNTRKRNAGHG